MSDPHVEICHVKTDDGHVCVANIPDHLININGVNGISTSSINNIITITTNAPYQDLLTWTPIIAGSAIPGVGTYTAQSGYYTTIGNMVFITGHVTWTNHTGTGNMLLDGLPFAGRNLANLDPEFIFNPENIPLPNSTVSLLAEVEPANTFLNLNSIKNNGANSPIAMATSGQIHFSGWYVK